ncbi:MAG: hypothetical protein EKK46_00905 [Rhodocyclaceae bacterium]|nr:MAG: hypothetical protein EKK46_00905 [Rhodocyclaceae bacterium]
MQREAQRVLTGVTYTRKARDGDSREHSYRVTRCHRNPYHRLWKPGVDVVAYPDTGKFGYGNLVTCGSTWHCPLCAPKITEYRRAELAAGAARVIGQGGEIVMMTLTYRHDADMRLADSLDAFYTARDKFFSCRAVKETMRQVEAMGRVYSTEVTFGANGWHPHLHVLVLCEKRRDDLVDRLETLRGQWSRAVMKSGLGKINDHGFDVRNGDYAAEYIAKYGHEPAVFAWSAAHELTKGHVKQGRGGNVTPFDLLGVLATGKSVSIGNREIGPDDASDLFREYAIRFQGRQQLVWSKGLRDKLGIQAERSDEEIAEGDGERDVIGTLTLDEWRMVLGYKNGRGQLLAMLGKHGRSALPWIIESLKKAKPNHPDEPWFSEEKKFVGY